MRADLDKIENAITPLFGVHGVDLVALEWLQGPGHGILRITVDRPGGDPRETRPDKSVGIEEITHVTRDVSTTMDALDLIEVPYTLEIGSPGPMRPVQKRADFDRFAGLGARIEARTAERERVAFSGTLRGTSDRADGNFAACIEVGGTVREIERDRIVRARLHEIAVPTPKTGTRTSRRQERLAAREAARAINAAHLAARVEGEPAMLTERKPPAELSPGAKR